MNRLMAWVVGLVAALATSLAFANATAVTVSGNVSAQTGVSASRIVRQGDILRAGDMVITGANSNAVLKFEDGQIAVVGPNSKMAIQAFEYNPQSKSGNIVLALLQGGMRAITGFIGQTNPQRVTYKAGNYTIGIRGTDVTIVVDGIEAVVTVETGVITFTVGTRTITVNAGQGAVVGSNGQVNTGSVSAIVQAITGNPTLLNTLQQTGTVTLPAGTVGVSGAAPGQTVTVTSTPTQTGGQTGGGGGGGGSPGGGTSTR